MNKTSNSKLEANARYDAKTYKMLHAYLHNERDKNLIEGFKEAKEHGYSYREYLRQLFDVAK